MDLVLETLRSRMQERQCRVGDPRPGRGRMGIVEKVFQARKKIAGTYHAKVILDSGRVVYSDIRDVYVF